MRSRSTGAIGSRGIAVTVFAFGVTILVVDWVARRLHFFIGACDRGSRAGGHGALAILLLLLLPALPLRFVWIEPGLEAPYEAAGMCTWGVRWEGMASGPGDRRSVRPEGIRMAGDACDWTAAML